MELELQTLVTPTNHIHLLSKREGVHECNYKGSYDKEIVNVTKKNNKEEDSANNIKILSSIQIYSCAFELCWVSHEIVSYQLSLVFAHKKKFDK